MIQGTNSNFKSLTVHVTTIEIFSRFPFVYGLIEQTEVVDLLGKNYLNFMKLLFSHFQQVFLVKHIKM
jgi:hypothetical protein